VTEADLEAAILAAHVKGDGEPERTDELAKLYYQAARLKSADGKEDAAAFLMTHAYVFALDAGLMLAEAAHAYLRKNGREA